MSQTTRKLCLLGIGTALFVALTLCLQVPVFENYYLCLGYAVMAVYCYSFGGFSGTVIGVFGVVLYCLLTSGLRGMPGWALGNVAIGVILGIMFRLTKGMKHPALSIAVQIAAIAAASALGILIIKSVTECLLYAQPMAVRIGKNLYAFVADMVMLIVSLPLCITLDKPARKLFPGLIKE